MVGILGIVGPLTGLNSGWMITDFGTWAFLITQMKGFSPACSIWHTIRPISPLFLDVSIIFGEVGCDRLMLSLPVPFKAQIDPVISAQIFNTKCLLSLKGMALSIQPGKKIVLLLIEQGSFGDGGF